MAENIALAFKVMGQGMLGIFIVTCLIIGAISLLARMPGKRSKS